MKVALTTCVLGQRFEKLFAQHVWSSWQDYAHRFSYDLVVFRKLLAPLPGKKLPWQKLLILEQPELRAYDRIVWIDSDIVIRGGAPDVLEGVPSGALAYAIDEGYTSYAERWYREFNLPAAPLVIQTGLMCLEPHHQSYFQESLAYPDTSMSEMPALSLLLNKVTNRQILDGRFNALTESWLKRDLPPFIFRNKVIKELSWLSGWPPFRRSVLELWKQNWFVHAAGAKRDLLKLSWARATLAKEMNDAA